MITYCSCIFYCFRGQCQYCKGVFTPNNCKRHEQQCRSNPARTTVCLICESCNSSFNRRDNYNYHLKYCDNVANKTRKRGSTIPCLIDSCKFKFPNKTILFKHLRLTHSDKITIKDPVVRTFATYEEFISWKEQEEEDTSSYFTKGMGSINNRHFFYCQRVGSGGKKSSSKGRVKVGNLCISKIKITREEGKPIEMTYYPIHNHRLPAEEDVHHPLPAAVSNVINQEIAEEVSTSEIFKKVNDSYVTKRDQGSNSCKINCMLIKKNISERVRKQKNAKQLDKDDAKAVYLFAQEEKDKDSVILCKPFSEPTHQSSDVIREDRNKAKLLSTMKDKIKALEDFHAHAENNDLPESTIRYVNSCLSDAILKIESLKSKECKVEVMKPPKKIPPLKRIKNTNFFVKKVCKEKEERT